jgi:hypothetical protein
LRIADCGLRIEEKQSGKTSPVLSFPNPKSKCGFTLIEIVVALGVLVIGVTSVFALFAAGGATHRKATSQNAAALISDSVFAHLRERFDIHAELDDLTVAPGEGKLSGYPGFTYELKLEHIEGDEYLAVCTVSWKRAGVPVSTAFTTIVIRRLSAAARGTMPSPLDEENNP